MTTQYAATSGKGSDSLFRTREGIERFFITYINNAANTNLSVNTGRIRDHFNHVPGGSNVLYLNGYVEFIKFPVSNFLSLCRLGTRQVADISEMYLTDAASSVP